LTALARGASRRPSVNEGGMVKHDQHNNGRGAVLNLTFGDRETRLAPKPKLAEEEQMV